MISKRSSQAGVVLVIVLALAATAAAADKKADAEVHYDQGKAYYKAGAFDLAIQEFLAGYKLDPRPGVLFNIARGYEELKDRNKAIEFYKKYIDLGAAAAAATEARARMVVLERQIKDEADKKKADEAERERQRQLALNPPPPAPAMPAPVDSTAPAAPVPVPAAPAPAQSAPEGAVSVTAAPTTSPETAKKLKVAGIVTGGAGVVLAGVGAFFAVRASSLKSEINTELAKSDPPAWMALQGKNSDMESAQTMAVVGLVAGGVAIAGGATLYYLGLRKTPHDGGATAMVSPSIVPQVGPQGGSLLLTGRF